MDDAALVRRLQCVSDLARDLQRILERLWFPQILISLIHWELSFRPFSPRPVFSAVFASLLLSFRRRVALQLEVVALRHQLGVLQRSVNRPRLTRSDRLLWAWRCRVWPE
jgi:hypothetical protein